MLTLSPFRPPRRFPQSARVVVENRDHRLRQHLQSGFSQYQHLRRVSNTTGLKSHVFDQNLPDMPFIGSPKTKELKAEATNRYLSCILDGVLDGESEVLSQSLVFLSRLELKPFVSL